MKKALCCNQHGAFFIIEYLVFADYERMASTGSSLEAEKAG